MATARPPNAPAGADEITIGVHKLPVWPKGQDVRSWRNTNVLVTRFGDHDLYASALRAEVLARAADPKLSQKFEQSAGIGSAKVFDVEKWPLEAASLVSARALQLFRLAAKGGPAVVDVSWASVYHDGDYCMPHSHPRTMISVLYVPDVGDAEGDNNGRFYFADPRLAPCCQEEAGYVSTPSAPIFEPGMMLLFPGAAVHFVTPYRGERPRITMSWNLNQTAKAGSPLPDWVQRPG
jgi:hypothetical protein